LQKYRVNINYPIPDSMGEFSFEGKIELYEKINPKSTKRFIYCLTNVEVFNEVLGNFYLNQGQTYFFNLGTVGRNPLLKRDNIWIAKRKIPVLQEEKILKNTDEVLKLIANKI